MKSIHVDHNKTVTVRSVRKAKKPHVLYSVNRWKEIIKAVKTASRLGGDKDEMSVRKEFIHKTSWMIVTKEMANRLAFLLKPVAGLIIDPCAGTGWLAYHLRQRGVTMEAYDNESDYFGTKRPNYGYRVKDVKDQPIEKADVIVLTWPGYRDETWTNVLKRMKPGALLVYNGEFYFGCCAADSFFKELEENFHEDFDHGSYLNSVDNHVTWSGIHDGWAVYIKKTN